jgi:hypothetical protein
MVKKILVTKESTKTGLLVELMQFARDNINSVVVNLQSVPEFLNTPVAVSVFLAMLKGYPKKIYWYSDNEKIANYLKTYTSLSLYRNVAKDINSFRNTSTKIKTQNVSYLNKMETNENSLAVASQKKVTNNLVNENLDDSLVSTPSVNASQKEYLELKDDLDAGNSGLIVQNVEKKSGKLDYLLGQINISKKNISNKREFQQSDKIVKFNLVEILFSFAYFAGFVGVIFLSFYFFVLT